MIKLILLFMLIVFFNACGGKVDTASSSKVDSSQGNSDGTADLIDPNPVDDPDDNATDPSKPDDNATDPGDITPGDAVYDTTDAVYDKNACDASFYRTLRDSTLVGNTSMGENGASFALANEDGLEVASRHSEGSLSNRDKTWVVMYYKAYPQPSALGQSYVSFTKSGVFSVNYDMAWNDKSVADVDNTIYVRSDNYDHSEDSLEKPSCYRASLDSDVGSEIVVQKVYR